MPRADQLQALLSFGDIWQVDLVRMTISNPEEGAPGPSLLGTGGGERPH